MAPPKKSGSSTKTGKTRLLDMPAVGRVPDASGGSWDAKVNMSDDLLRKKYRERARKAALTKRKRAKELEQTLKKVYKEVDKVANRPDKGKRPLSGAALQARNDKLQRDEERRARDEEAKLAKDIQEQAERDVQQQLEQEKAERNQFLRERDAQRIARGKLVAEAYARQRQASAPREADVDIANQEGEPDSLGNDFHADGTVGPVRKSFLGSLRGFIGNAKHAYDNPRWVPKANAPTGIPKKGFHYDGQGDLWKDGQKVTGRDKNNGTGKLATEYNSAKEDALNKPTGLPGRRQEDVAKWKAVTESPVQEMRTQNGRRALFQVNMVDRQGKPMDVVFEREVSELEKLAGIQQAQSQWEKQNKRKEDSKEFKTNVDGFRLGDHLKMPGVVNSAAKAFLKPAKNLLGELANVAEGVLGVAGIFAALWGLKTAADNAVPIVTGIVDSILSVEEGFYRMTGQKEKADAIAKQRKENRGNLKPEDQKTADTTSTATDVVGGLGALWAGSKVAKFVGGAARMLGIGGGEAAAGGAAVGTAAVATAGLATLGVEGYLGVYKPVWGKEGKDTTEIFKMAASGDPKAAIMYVAANRQGASDADLINYAAGTMTQGVEGVQKSGRDLETNKKLAAQALASLKQQYGGKIPTGQDAINAAKKEFDAPANPSGMPGATLGIRNNNPGNLRASPTSFQKFNTPEEGLQAESHQLGLYFNGGSQAAGYEKLDTVAKVINKWAPASDKNDTPAYIAAVSKALGVGPNDPIDLNNQQVRTTFMQAINRQENSGLDPYSAEMYRTAIQGSFEQAETRNGKGTVNRGTVPVQPSVDPGLLKQQIAAQQAINNAPAGSPVAQTQYPLPSNWQQKPGLQTDYMDNINLLVMNGGALAS
jgi:hypothetical protein